ncbi:MAG TPA: MraY family glycosyltransferase [Candidatus Dormibacteraeota bacterium]|nr:MraY family glycosyltransferase [Candidatus Dormibacteraeota bacterium]
MPTATNHYFSALPIMVVAVLVTMATVPLARWFSFRVGAVAQPGGRHIHPQPTGRLGGLAIMVGFVVSMTLFGRQVQHWLEIVAIAVVVAVLLAVDDILGLAYWTKLVIQAVCSLAVAWIFAISITSVNLPGGLALHLAWATIPISIIWLMGMQNSINLLDGVDGLAAGVVAIVGGVLYLAAVNRLGVEPSQGGVILLSSALIGCCLGFLVFNFSPARIFMGDSGSHLLGMLVGIITIVGVAKVTVALALFVPVLALALPIGDTAFAILRRRRQGVGFAQADARHLHHRLLALGLSPRETAISFYLVTAILGCLGLALFGHRTILAVALGLLVLTLGLLLWRIWHRGGFAFQKKKESEAPRLDRPHV